MRVARYQAHHVLGVKDIDFQLAGHHLFLVGGDNEAGKTSAIQALLMALCGRSGMDFPDVALQDGKDEGWVKVDLAPDDGERGLTVELFLKRKRNGQVIEEFQVTDSEGNPAKEPRSLLKRLYSLRAFDPLEFERLGRKEKRDLLVKMLGLDFGPQKKEHKALYEERAAVNRTGVTLKARWEAMPWHGDAPDAEVSIGDLLTEKRSREEHNAANERERDRLEGLEQGMEALDADLEELDAKIAELQRRRVEKAAQLDRAVLLVNAQRKTVEVLEDQDVNAVVQQVSTAEATNRKVRENAARTKAGKELDELRNQAQSLTDRMKDIEYAMQTAMQGAAWPIEGLSIDDEGVLYAGLPFEQACKSKRILTSTLIGMSLNPKLKLLVCEDGNDLGSKTLEDLQKLLEERGYQMLLEVVTRSEADEDRCAVVIEGGKVKTARKPKQ